MKLYSQSMVIHIFVYEPRHDKANNVAVCPAKTQISLGIRPVWSGSSLSAWRKLGSLATHWAHSEDWSDWAHAQAEDWSDWADAQADLNLRWAHTHVVGFDMSRLIYRMCRKHFSLSITVANQVNKQSLLRFVIRFANHNISCKYFLKM